MAEAVIDKSTAGLTKGGGVAHSSEACIWEVARQDSHQRVQKWHEGSWLRVDGRLHGCSTRTSLISNNLV